MRKNLETKTKRILTLVLALCMMFAVSIPAFAEEGTALTATDDPRDSIMNIWLGYENDNGEFFRFKGGTCFLINDEYVLTNKHVISFDESNNEFEQFKAMESVPDDIKPTDAHIKLYLYVNRDMKVAATMHKSVNSDDMDFAAVKLAEKVYDRKPVALGDSAAIETKDPVYAMGFPADSARTKDYNTKDDVSTVGGTVSKITVTGNVDIIEHTAQLNDGNSGGPLLDENNNVIGVNTFVADKKNYSVQINFVKKGLDTFGIPYVNGTETVTDDVIDDDNNGEGEDDINKTEEEVPDNTAIIAELQSALEEAKGIDTDGYTEESVGELDDCIGAAEAVLKNSTEDAAAIQGATDDLNEAIEMLEEKQGISLFLIIGIGAAVVIIIVIIIIVVVSGKSKKSNAAKGGYQAAPGGMPSGMQGQAPVQRQVPPAPAPAPYTPPTPAPMGMSDENPTTLLDAGAGETTLLSNAGSAYLLRKKNGEKIPVNLQSFKIGKERKRVNYCISDNTSISRIHCEIVKRGADYYVSDQGSTNFTFINGVQLSPRKETLLSDRSVLKLSDEEFEFHLS